MGEINGAKGFDSDKQSEGRRSNRSRTRRVSLRRQHPVTHSSPDGEGGKEKDPGFFASL